jgi:enamine deaminase RidA (YjgF/YER057c/UK114 family)
MVQRTNIASGSPWEPLRGFSRAVRVGDHLYISGTTALAATGEVIGGEDPYLQTKYVIELVKQILTREGFSMTDVVRTRLSVTNIGKWDDYARAHREAFEQTRPASSIVQVSRLVDPRLLVELEADAVLGCDLPVSYRMELGTVDSR